MNGNGNFNSIFDNVWLDVNVVNVVDFVTLCSEKCTNLEFKLLQMCESRITILGKSFGSTSQLFEKRGAGVTFHYHHRSENRF